jgi:ketosteroid isomerase-like protein
MILQPDDAIVVGHDNIRKWVDGYFTTFKTQWTKVVAMNWVCGDFGFDQGHDTAVDIPRAGGDPIHSDCKGILIYKRQTNGEWLVFRDIWNSNKPPA